MTDHIAVRIIDANKIVFSGRNDLQQAVGDFFTLHQRFLFERNNIGWNFFVSFQLFVKLAEFIAVEKVSHVTVLLRFADGKTAHTGFRQIFTHGAVNLRRRNKILLGNVKVAVILHHTGILNFRNAFAIETIEIAAAFKRSGDFQRPIAAEIEKNHAVAVVDSSNRFSVFGNNKRRQILIDFSRFTAQRLNRFGRRIKHSALTEDVCFPPFANHLPVGVVTVHGDDHPTAAGSKTGIKTAVAHRLHFFFQRSKIFQRRCFADIASVKQSVNANFGNALGFRLFQHGF